jgi:CubicO group peptidase (beta-lactamase class C family)
MFHSVLANLLFIRSMEKTMIRYFLVLILILTLTVGSVGFPQRPTAPPNRNETTTDRINKLFEQWDKPDSAGCALGVFKDGKIIFERGYGMADLEHSAPITPETLFDIGSIAKQFTALAILLLVQQGKVSLDEMCADMSPRCRTMASRSLSVIFSFTPAVCEITSCFISCADGVGAT